MTDSSDSPSDIREERMALVMCPLLCAAASWILGSMVCHVLNLVVGLEDGRFVMFPLLVAGFVGGAILGYRWVVGRREVRAAARTLGFRPVSRRLRDRITRRLRSMFTDSISFSNAMGRSLKRVRLVVGVMTQLQSSGDSTTRSDHTIAWIESRSLRLPRFTLSPEHSFTEFFGSFLKLQDYNFADSPEFSRSYQLSGDDEAPVRALFSPEVREFFATRSGWTLMGHRSRLLLYRHKEVVPADEFEDFVRQSIGIFRLMARNVHFVEAHHAEHGPVTEKDVVADALKIEGVAGRLIRSRLRRQLVTSDDLTAFLSQSAPRELPDPLQNRYAVDIFLRIWCGLFLTAGLGAIAVSILLAGQGPQAFIVGGLGVAFTAIGSLVLWLAGVSGRRARHLLTNGTLTEGRISGVRETSIVVGNERRHWAHVQFEVDGHSQKARCGLYSGDAMRARQFAEDETPVELLYAPNNPQRILITSLLTLGP